MFNVAVQADLQIVERHPHSMLVPYVPPGRDATILWAHKDLRFRNNKDTPIVIWSGVYGQTLFIALYGQYYPPLVEWHYEELGRNKTWVIKRQNPNLPTGEVRTMEGMMVSGRTGFKFTIGSDYAKEGFRRGLLSSYARFNRI